MGVAVGDGAGIAVAVGIGVGACFDAGAADFSLDFSPSPTEFTALTW